MEAAGRVQVRTVLQPVWTEGHPAPVQLAHAEDNLQEVPGHRYRGHRSEVDRDRTALPSLVDTVLICRTDVSFRELVFSHILETFSGINFL